MREVGGAPHSRWVGRAKTGRKIRLIRHNCAGRRRPIRLPARNPQALTGSTGTTAQDAAGKIRLPGATQGENTKKRAPVPGNPLQIGYYSAYFESSASAALAFSAAGPAVTFWKAEIACGFISLAL